VTEMAPFSDRRLSMSGKQLRAFTRWSGVEASNPSGARIHEALANRRKGRKARFRGRRQSGGEEALPRDPQSPHSARSRHSPKLPGPCATERKRHCADKGRGDSMPRWSRPERRQRTVISIVRKIRLNEY
jgi:hypothetical protein